MNLQELIAIDVHVHAEVSCCQPVDPIWQTYEDAASKYFKAPKRPTIAETVTYYREKKIGFVMFTVDMESEVGSKRIPNEEIIDAARENRDIMRAFASIDPHKGKFGVREARRLIEEHGVSGFKFHPTLQGFFPNDRLAYRLYEVIAEYKLPAIFHSGHSGRAIGVSVAWVHLQRCKLLATLLQIQARLSVLPVKNDELLPLLCIGDFDIDLQ